jgi:hypothetical protein
MEGGTTKGIWRLEEYFIVCPCVKIFGLTKPFEVHTNVSDFAISGVFMQDGHLIVFENKKLCGAQLWWPIHEKELYVILCCLKSWQFYLGMHKIKAYIDKVSLWYFETQPRASMK